MLADFFYKLRQAAIPVSITEYLALLGALERGLAGCRIDGFYFLARTALVKDERCYDRFDRVFGSHFKGVETLFDEGLTELPREWLRRQAELLLSDAEKAQIEALGGWDELMETLKQRLAEQRRRHQGGSKWIGTAGRSPFGAHGYNPRGIRIGQPLSRERRAVKVWDKRAYANLDDTIELGTRNIKLALRRLRRFAREGAARELDLDDTVRSTARNAGWLDLKMVPERHNAVRVLLFLDVGGSMNDHVRVCEELFSAARSEFRHLVHFYFHNCPYESLWTDNLRRHSERTPTLDVIHTYGREYKLVFVGDATMSPYEILQPGGSVEHMNEEAGAVWLRRLLDAYPHAIWLNPQPESAWEHIPSLRMTREILGDRMFPMTLEGLDRGMRRLRHTTH